MDIEAIARIVVDCGYKVHTGLGPGLLESVYEVILAHTITQRGLLVQLQYPVPIEYEGITFAEGFRADLLIAGQLLVELKSVELLAPVHSKQVLTYLRLLRLPLGLLINFGAPTFKAGIKRIVNNHVVSGSSLLRIHQPTPEDSSGQM